MQKSIPAKPFKKVNFKYKKQPCRAGLEIVKLLRRLFSSDSDSENALPCFILWYLISFSPSLAENSKMNSQTLAQLTS